MHLWAGSICLGLPQRGSQFFHFHTQVRDYYAVEGAPTPTTPPRGGDAGSSLPAGMARCDAPRLWQMEARPINGYDMAFIEVSEGPPLVCLHGTLGDTPKPDGAEVKDTVEKLR